MKRLIKIFEKSNKKSESQIKFRFDLTKTCHGLSLGFFTIF